MPPNDKARGDNILYSKNNFMTSLPPPHHFNAGFEYINLIFQFVKTSATFVGNKRKNSTLIFFFKLCFVF